MSVVCYIYRLTAVKFYKIYIYSMDTAVVGDCMTLKYLFMGDILIWE